MGAQKPIMNIEDYLTFEALEDDFTIRFYYNECMYSIDGIEEWVALAAGADTPPISAGQTISFKAYQPPITENYGIGRFNIQKKCNVSGNMLSMEYGDYARDRLLKRERAFQRCFQYSNIVDASRLKLPKNVTFACYYYMFYGSSQLEIAPELPATEPVSQCYIEMFAYCPKLNYVKAMLVGTNEELETMRCMRNWLLGVAATGTFIKNAEATWDIRGSSGIPEGWTVEEVSV